MGMWTAPSDFDYRDQMMCDSEPAAGTCINCGATLGHDDVLCDRCHADWIRDVREYWGPDEEADQQLDIEREER